MLLARAYIVSKNVTKARHQLKRVAKLVWNSEDARYFEVGRAAT